MHILSLTLLTILLFLPDTILSDRNTFDCKMRQLAVDYAHKIQPFRTRQHFQQLADALNGAPEAKGCNVTVPNLPDSKFGTNVPYFKIPVAAGTTVYVDAVHGKDTNDGNRPLQPFQTIQRALQATRAAGAPSIIVLREGTFYLNETLSLTPADNGLQFINSPGEMVWISGGIPLLHPTWKPYHVGGTPKQVTYHDLIPVPLIPDRGDTSNIKFLGEFKITEECISACRDYKKDVQNFCRSFIFFTPENAKKFPGQCFAVINQEWNLVHSIGAVSGKMAVPNVYVTDLSSYGLSSVTGLRINDGRSIRARYPNSNPELGFGSNLYANSWLPPNLPTQPDIEINPVTPIRDTSGSFQKYQLGIGGPCKNFDPPAGYWCGNRTEGGGAFTYRVPTGMVANKATLPNTPYKNAVGAVVQTWRPAHWASWMFEVGSYEASTGTFKFSKGGFQGARGENKGDNFYIENVFEELDSPNEWFYDTTSKQLYLWYNGTGVPPATDNFVVTSLQTLFNVVGTQSKPVKGVSFMGLNFRDTAYTYLNPHSMPSGGDWGFQRSGALFLEGTENVVIDSCLFTRLDGNAVMISGYNRFATIQKSEFSWIGDTAIGSWGNAKGTSIPGMGWDGTDGDQPRFNKILLNFVHELGIWEKQSSFYFQAKSCQNLLQGNIFFNGPRAGINFNDGFGGGSNLTENIVLNTCRESGDHGPFNSWDRQVYVTSVRTGSPSVIKEWDNIYNNFMIANYNSQEAIDNDDGSCYYNTHNNFFAYSGNGMKSDFGGHDNRHSENIYAYVGQGYDLSGQLSGHEDYFFKNKVILNQDGTYGHGTCSGTGKTVVHDNQVFTPTGSVSECGMTLENWQKEGNDPGTTAAKLPEDDVLVGWIKQLLGL